MPSLKTNFEELIERMQRGRDIGPASFEPVYYLIFPPAEILEVKRSLPAWTARLRNEGWDVHALSIAECIDSVLKSAAPRRIWLAADRKAPQSWKRTNEALANALSQGALQQRIEAKLTELQNKPNALLDCHGYRRLCTLTCASGHRKLVIREVPHADYLPLSRRTHGKTRLKFMGFYPEDGNYRSVHVGGWKQFFNMPTQIKQLFRSGQGHLPTIEKVLPIAPPRRPG